MPTSIVKTKEDERLWKKAKKLADAQGRKEDYAYIVGIFKKMKREGKTKEPWEMTRAEFFKAQNIRSAIKLENETIIGTPGEIHAMTLERALEERPHIKREKRYPPVKDYEYGFVDKSGKWLGRPGERDAVFVNKEIEGRHKKSIRQAILEGKPVPQKVLADYPDLSMKKTRKPKIGHLGPRKR